MENGLSRYAILFLVLLLAWVAPVLHFLRDGKALR
jgi:hypothetical protein